MTFAEKGASVLGIVILLTLLSLLMRSRNASSAISLDDLLLGSDGRLSKSACVMFGAFLLSTWVIVYQTLAGSLSDATFAAYLAAWVAPLITHAVRGRRQPPEEGQ